MPSYKLHYFDARGAAELIRLAFHAAGVPFEDVRIKHEDWPAIKDSFPTKALPCLEIDNKMKIPQSLSIARFIAHSHGLFGKTDIQHVLIDALIETYKDLVQCMIKFHFEKDEAKTAEMKAKFLAEELPKYLGNFEELLGRNNKGDGFFIGDSMTLADLQAMHVADALIRIDANCLKPYPKLSAHMNRVQSQPKIAAYLKVRPKTEH